MNLAFLGIGIMGSRMTANLVGAGHSVHVWNRTRGKLAPLKEIGCPVADTPRAAVKCAEVVFTMLADPRALEEVALGPNGFLDGLPKGSTWVDHSTVDPATSRRMGAEAIARGLHFLDIPVSGSSGAAQNGKLVFFAGGEIEDLERVEPLLSVMGSRVVHAGSVGAGTTLKLVNNLFMAQVQTAWSEALGLATRLGLSEKIVHEAILPTHVAPAFLGFKRAKIEAREWSPEFPLKHALKDIRLALAAAKESGISLPQLAASERIYAQAVKQGLGDSDISAVHEVASKSLLPSDGTVIHEASNRG